ncbi:MAG TPA: DUF1631 family protein [Arenimonas sp.]|nr:DUF1631 family protein [Arenimonas sp.]
MSGNLNSSRPFPGHEALFQQTLLVSKIRLSGMLHKCISMTDKMLHDICQDNQSLIGSPNIENLRLLRSATNVIELSYSKAIEKRFSAFQKLLNSNTTSTMDLQLVDIGDLDDVVNTEIISEALSRNFKDVIEINSRRFCVLFGLPSEDLCKAPLNEKHVAEYLRAALHGLELPAKVCALLFRNYEKVLLDLCLEMFEAVNEPLIKAGILPHLVSLKETESANKTKAVSKPRTGGEIEHRHIDQVSATSAPLGTTEHALFEEICNYLHTWRPQHERANVQPSSMQSPARSYSSEPKRPFATHEMISVLSMLQTSIPDSISSAMRNVDASVSMLLKAEMLNSAKKIGLPAGSYEINRDDEDAVDLVGMLFDVLLSERDFRDEAKNMMSRLVVPYTKAAVLDKRLFLTKAHPARKLLNALTEAIEGNQGDGPQERELLNKAEGAVDRLISDFNEDIAIFELLEQEMRSYMDQHKRRIDLAEKRAKEAQRGQERLENARMLAARELEERTQNVELPSVIQDFLSRYWTHHLSMIALREGEDSGSWNSAIQLANDIILILNSEPADARYDSILQKRSNIESVLSSSGVLADTSLALVNKIAESATHYQAPKIVKPANTEQLTENTSAVSSLSESSLRMVFNKDALDYDTSDADYFKSLEIGTWLQLEGSGGNYSPIKLAWVSPISSRLMFVNRRGVRVLVVSVEELAEMKKQGKLIVHEQESVFEQTLDRVLNRLKTDFA